jgi:pimeloyl-ACP methyl ester carboxylesterase
MSDKSEISFLEIKIPQKIKLEYQVTGSGKPILFIHGGGTDFHFYKVLIETLSTKYKVYTFSYPGFGKSSSINKYSINNFKKVIDAFLTHFELKEIFIVGHSLGAGIALSYSALNHDLNIIGIAAISPFIYPVKKSSFKLTKDLAAQWQVEKSNIPVIEKKKYNFFNFIKYKLKHSLNSLRLYVFIHKTDLSHYLKKLTIPVLGFYAENDIVLNPDDQIKGFKLVKNIKIFKFENLGHNAFFSKREFILEQIEKIYSNDN